MHHLITKQLTKKKAQACSWIGQSQVYHGFFLSYHTDIDTDTDTNTDTDTDTDTAKDFEIRLTCLPHFVTLGNYKDPKVTINQIGFFMTLEGFS